MTGAEDITLTFVGCGDAFGSGGRFNTCFHVQTPETRFLIDCGASSLIAMKALGVDRNPIESILITHFHGDHFGGIPYFMLDAQFFSKRTGPLTIVGPTGLEHWIERTMETAFPGSSRAKRKFDLNLIEIEPGTTHSVGSLEIHAEQALHGAPDGPFLAYRISTRGKTIAYTGDTEWTGSLVPIGKNADLLIAEAYFFDKQVPFHLDLATLADRLPDLTPKRLILTHMNEDMLARTGSLDYETASDGMVVTL
ncbi:MBL fold metallo-hydrolase [Nisaea acidiphila]|uniref:MBL fold metallo-hydrolase n=1 Tax=Nisaea acidiphila TaxID=1862145 RepID=A0A9J7ATW0_9PROT|nr:MBL fold metallo-hydrolase [Nisaea acidiphila]UUX50266.1 MBL fold metallo-hydrolase [Nisaea acidiphila]